MIIMTLTSLVGESYIQYGFAGFAFAMLGIIVWMFKLQNKTSKENVTALVDVIQGNNTALTGVSEALNSVKDSESQVKYSVEKLNADTNELNARVNQLRTELKCRPCMHKEL